MESHETAVSRRIRAAFTVPEVMDESSRDRIAAAIAGRRPEHFRRSRHYRMLAGIAVSAAAVIAILAWPAGQPSSALAAVNDGLAGLEVTGVVHYKVVSSGQVLSRGRALRTFQRSDEYWVDNDRRLARWETHAATGEAVEGIYVTRDGRDYSLQTDLVDGRELTTSRQGPSGRVWSDDFDGTIRSLRDSISAGDAEIVRTTVLDGKAVTVVRMVDAMPGAAEVVQTFWLDAEDHVPLRIEVENIEITDGKRSTTLREVRRITGFEVLQRSALVDRLFELEDLHSGSGPTR